jgi:hypothetical protein
MKKPLLVNTWELPWIILVEVHIPYNKGGKRMRHNFIAEIMDYKLFVCGKKSETRR